MPALSDLRTAVAVWVIQFIVMSVVKYFRFYVVIFKICWSLGTAVLTNVEFGGFVCTGDTPSSRDI